MRCIECGHELKDGAVFCIRCGAMQVSKDKTSAASGGSQKVKPAARTTGAQHNVKNFKPTPRRSTASIVAPVVGVVAALAAVGALAMFVINPGTSGTPESSTTTTTTSQSQSASSESSSSASSSASSKSASSKSASSKSASSASAASAGAATTTGGSTANGSTTTDANNGGTTTTDNGAAAQQAQTQTYVEPQAEQQTYYATDGGYYRDDTSSRYYTDADVQNMSNEDLFYARNEIFARHGRMFSDPNLQAYFNSKTWYTPLYGPSEFDSMPSPLNDVEQKNVQLMMSVEQARGSAYL